MARMVRTRKDAFVIILALLVVLLIVNFLSSRHFVRLDLTEEKEYTLAHSTKKILKNLEDVITIRVYFSRNLPPALLPLKRSVDDVLAEYRNFARGNLRVEYFDPSSDVRTLQKVRMLGIPPLTVNVLQRDKQEVVKIYLGMAVLFGDKQEVIPVVKDTLNLEYRLTSAILKVSTKELPAIGWWLIASDIKGKQRDFSIIREGLANRYRIVNVSEDGSNLDVDKFGTLILISPRNFTRQQKERLHTYISKGGKLLALLDSVEVGNALSASVVKTGLDDLFDSYGVGLGYNLVADRINSYAAFSGGFITYQVPYPFWPKIVKDGFDSTFPAVSQLESLVLPWTSAFSLKDELPDGVKVLVLARSSRYSALVESENFELAPDAANSVVRTGTGEQYPLVVHLKGSFGNLYPTGKGDKKKEKLSESEIILVGSSRFVQDGFIRQFDSNLVFFDNVVDYLSFGEALIGIRSRGATDRSIIEISPTAKAAVRLANTMVMPLVLVCLGVVLMVVRRRKMKTLRMAFD